MGYNEQQRELPGFCRYVVERWHIRGEKNVAYFVTNKYMGDSDRATRYYLSKRMEAFDLGGNRFIFFVAIARNPGCSQADICRITLFDKAIVARCVAKLESLGYITRQYYEGDRKTSHLFLTEKGEGVFDQVQQIVSSWNEQISEDIGMTPEEVEIILKKVAKATRKRVNELCGLDCIVDD